MNDLSIIKLFSAVFLIVLANAENIGAGYKLSKIEPALLRKVQEVNNDEILKIEIEVQGGISAKQLALENSEHGVTLHERRLYGLKRLRDVASVSQQQLRDYLDKLKRLNLVQKYECHWLTNSITVQTKIEGIDSLITRTDVVSAFQYAELKALEIEKSDFASLAQNSRAGVEPNLTFIGADSAWRMGFTGKGSIVCVFDLCSVDGGHPALLNNWKGHDGDTSAAVQWGEFPTNSGCDHGTLLAGIMVGHDDVTGDTIGVAPDAKWILGGFDFEWAADPDNDPSTTADMPDVINISRSTSGDCYDQWWKLIDMVEALGIVVVMAAGNGGPSQFSIISPASRALDSLTNFAVGSVDHFTSNVWFSSSRGPSDCDGISIKPNLVAPGNNIRTSELNEMYGYHGGTSLAAPHVAGAVAILRQFAPNATAREIKEALLGGAIHRGNPYPNNDFGWGILNIPASMEYLGQRMKADLRVAKFEYKEINVGDTLEAAIRITNRGYSTDSVFASFSSNYPGSQILSDSIYFGTLITGETASGKSDFRCVFDDTLLPGAILSVPFTICGSGGYLEQETLFVHVGIEGEHKFFTHTTDRLQFTISNFGQYGFGSNSMRNLGYSGFRFDDSLRNTLFDASFMLTIDSGQVSDCFQTVSMENDEDFWPDGSHAARFDSATSGIFHVTKCVFTDGRAEKPIGIRVEQKTINWNGVTENNFVVMEYIIHNISRNSLSNLIVGLAFEWLHGLPCQIDTNAFSYFSYEQQLGLVFSGHNFGQPCVEDTGRYRGLSVLNDEEVNSYSAIVRPRYADTGISEGEKFAALTGGISSNRVVARSQEQILQVISTGPFTLLPDESDTVAFAVIAGKTIAELKTGAKKSSRMWLDVRQGGIIPDTYLLNQNYPNPFNSRTVIEFSLPEATHVRIDIYNLLGQRVMAAVNRDLPAGKHQIKWDGKDGAGIEVASGVYFYRILTNEFVESRKMLLLK